MKRKTLAGIAIIAIVAGVIFSGCVEKETKLPVSMPDKLIPSLTSVASVGDFSIAVSEITREGNSVNLDFAITKVTDRDKGGGSLRVTLTDDHDNKYSGVLNVNLKGAPSQVIRLLPTGFTYVDSISINMPEKAPIETIRFGEEKEIAFEDVKIVEPSVSTS